MMIDYEAKDFMRIIEHRIELLEIQIVALKTTSKKIGPVRGLSIVQCISMFESDIEWLEDLKRFTNEALRYGSKVYLDMNEYKKLSYTMREWYKSGLDDMGNK